MRHTFAPVLLLALFAACGGGDGDDFGTPDGGTPVDGSMSSPDTFPSGDTSIPPSSDTGSGSQDSPTTGSEGGTSCSSLKCTSDTECQSACGTVSGGIECCDTATQVCFPTSSATCPASTGGSDGGTMY
jgi:hypothetical protein